MSNRRDLLQPDDSVDNTVRQEYAEIEHDVQAFSADMDSLERAQRIERLVWKRVLYYFEQWANESQRADDQESGLKVLQRIQEESEQKDAKMTALEQEFADYKAQVARRARWLPGQIEKDLGNGKGQAND